MNPSIVILFTENRLASWYIAPPAIPQRLKIHGQECLELSTQNMLAAAHDDLHERLQGEGWVIDRIYWLFDSPGRGMWVDAESHKAFSGEPLWQLLAWEWVAERFGLQGTTPWDQPEGWLEDQLLPWLVTADDAAERRQMQETLAHEHLSKSEQLARERSQLEKDNQRLREQNAALRQVDMERLLRFLPALFPRVFTVLGASDLALLCGRVIDPPLVQNPYPEPSEETLRVLQKDFRSLPLPFQRQIVAFVARLPQRQQLNPRPEMRELVLELEVS